MANIHTCMCMSGVVGICLGPRYNSLAAFAACWLQHLLACGMQPAAAWGLEGNGVCCCNLQACYSSVQYQPGMSHLDTQDRACHARSIVHCRRSICGQVGRGPLLKISRGLSASSNSSRNASCNTWHSVAPFGHGCLGGSYPPGSLCKAVAVCEVLSFFEVLSCPCH